MILFGRFKLKTEIHKKYQSNRTKEETVRTLLAGGRVYTAAGIKKCDVIINGTTIFALIESSYLYGI